jgi:hypothetical protein
MPLLCKQHLMLRRLGYAAAVLTHHLLLPCCCCCCLQTRFERAGAATFVTLLELQAKNK